jgi:hypothetical protein
VNQVVGPAVARAELDRLESAIVDPQRARGDEAEPDAPGEDTAGGADAPEPPD